MPNTKYNLGYIQDYLQRSKLPATKHEAISGKKHYFKNRKASPVRISEKDRVIKNKLTSIGKLGRSRSPNV